MDQAKTGTCVSHALSHRRADSPVPTGDITEEYALKLYVDATGDTTLEHGTWASVVCNELLRRGSISGYYWASDPWELRAHLLEVGSVCVGLDWYRSMFFPEALYNNYYVNVDKDSPIDGGHEILINGVNSSPSRGEPFYRIKNSWGASWGKNGTARIPCTQLEDLIFNQNGDAVVITENIGDVVAPAV